MNKKIYIIYFFIILKLFIYNMDISDFYYWILVIVIFIKFFITVILVLKVKDKNKQINN